MAPPLSEVAGSPSQAGAASVLAPFRHRNSSLLWPAMGQFVRPAALRLIGPASGGWLVAGLGIGPAILINAGTFVISIVLVLSLDRHQLVSHHHEPDEPSEGVLADLKEGFRFVRQHVWLWGTFLAAMFAYLLFMGPTEVLLPFVVRNIMHGSALDLGFVFASGGVG